MTLAFKKATREKAKARVALIGISGSGKTYSALAIAEKMGARVAVIDTERGSASKYVGRFSFDVLELESFSPETYIEAIDAARGYDVLVIDSLSHAWMGKDGALEQVDRAAKRSQSQNTFMAWRDVTPLHNRLVEAIVAFPGHVIVTMRAKSDIVLETGKNGKITPRKVGLAPIQREGLEYEFDVVGDLTLEHEWLINKTRCEVFDGAVITKPGADFANALLQWLNTGDATPTQPEVAKPAVALKQPEPRKPDEAQVPRFSKNWKAFNGSYAGAPLAEASASILLNYAVYLDETAGGLSGAKKAACDKARAEAIAAFKLVLAMEASTFQTADIPAMIEFIHAWNPTAGRTDLGTDILSAVNAALQSVEKAYEQKLEKEAEVAKFASRASVDLTEQLQQRIEGAA